MASVCNIESESGMFQGNISDSVLTPLTSKSLAMDFKDEIHIPNLTIDEQKVNTIQSLFGAAICIRIPEYQRAYSWELKQCTQFLEDLQEQRCKRYYLGQFLFERAGDVFYIIDGQQRLTTTILFLSAFAKVQSKKGKDIDYIRSTYLTDVFRTVGDDQIVFRQLTQKHLLSKQNDTETISQRRLLEAFNYFERVLSAEEEEVVLELRNTLDQTVW